MKRKDPTQFRERFKRWKEGELVYENGLALPAYEDGKTTKQNLSGRINDEVVYKEIMKDVARENYKTWGYESPEAAWLDQLNNITYNYRGYYSDPEFQNNLGNAKQHWPDKYKTPLHESFSNESVYNGKKSNVNPYGLRGGIWVGDKFIPAAWQRQVNIPKYEDGLTPRRKSEVNTNLATYNPEEDLYSTRYTLPEVTITGTNKRPHTHAPIHLSKNAYNMLTEDLLGAMTTGMNVLSPSLWYGAVRDADGIQDGFNRLMRGNSGFVTENFEREHPYISLGANLIGDAVVLGGPSGMKNLNLSINKSNFYRSHKVSNAIDAGVKENPVITAYNRNPITKEIGSVYDYRLYLDDTFPNSKIKDVLWHGSRKKGLEEFSTKYIGSNAPIKSSTGMYLAPDKYTAKSYGRKGGVYPVLLNTENPYITDQMFAIKHNGVNVANISPKTRNTILRNNDAVVATKRGEITFFEPDNALILGSNKDLLGFRTFMSKKPNSDVRGKVFYDQKIGDKTPLNILYQSDIDRIRTAGIDGLTDKSPSQYMFTQYFGMSPKEYKDYWYSKLGDVSTSYKERFLKRQLNDELDRALQTLQDVRRATSPQNYSWNNQVLKDGFDMLANLYSSDAYALRFPSSYQANMMQQQLIGNMRKAIPILQKRNIVDINAGIPMRVNASGMYDPHSKLIQVLDNGRQTIHSVTHEFSHASDDGLIHGRAINDIAKTPYIKISDYSRMKPKSTLSLKDFDYYNQDTEKRARIMALLSDMHNLKYNINSYNDIQDYLLFEKAFGNHNAESIFNNYDISISDLLDIMAKARTIVPPVIGVGAAYTYNK